MILLFRIDNKACLNMGIILFSELVSSNNFFLLLKRSFSLFDPYSGLGTYLQGIPTAKATDFFWGTNSGIRTLPILTFLTVLQKLFQNNWDVVFLLIALVLPFMAFLMSTIILHKLTLFSIIAAIFYGVNLWITTRIYTGFWQLNIAYAFLPFLVTIPIKISKLKILKKKIFSFWVILYAIIASLVMISQPHFLILVGLFSLFHILFVLAERKVISLTNLLIFYSFATFFFILLNAYFLVPSFLYPEITFTAPNQYFSLGSVAFNSQANFIEHVLRLDPLGFSSSSFRWDLLAYLQLVPITAFVLLFLLNKKRNYVFFILVSLFLFLAKGFNPPGHNLSQWIYQNIFFMHYFRDPARFLGGATLFAALSIG